MDIQYSTSYSSLEEMIPLKQGLKPMRISLGLSSGTLKNGFQ